MEPREEYVNTGPTGSAPQAVGFRVPKEKVKPVLIGFS